MESLSIYYCYYWEYKCNGIILIQQVWSKAWNLVALRSSQVMLMLFIEEKGISSNSKRRSLLDLIHLSSWTTLVWPWPLLVPWSFARVPAAARWKARKEFGIPGAWEPEPPGGKRFPEDASWQELGVVMQMHSTLELQMPPEPDRGCARDGDRDTQPQALASISHILNQVIR